MRQTLVKARLGPCLGVVIALVGVVALWLGPPLGAQQKDGPAQPQQIPAFPDGVVHVVLPPGPVKLDTFMSNGRHLLRVTVDKTVIEAKDVYFGDFKGGAHFEATKDGVHRIPAKGGQGIVFASWEIQPGPHIYAQDVLPVDKLKPGSVYVTSPSLKWGPDTKPPPR